MGGSEVTGQGHTEGTRDWGPAGGHEALSAHLSLQLSCSSALGQPLPGAGSAQWVGPGHMLHCFPENSNLRKGGALGLTGTRAGALGVEKCPTEEVRCGKGLKEAPAQDPGVSLVNSTPRGCIFYTFSLPGAQPKGTGTEHLLLGHQCRNAGGVWSLVVLSWAV